ncbi:hypothetical protein F0U59_38445 [Archangium gephyra]|nr:hypothetical protein F0U59_38445 [Archangium gephyra]
MDTAAQEGAGASLAEWAERLAMEVAPDELDLASTMAEAYTEGGAARRDLFTRAGPHHGGFGAGEVLVVMPWLLKAISQAGPLLLTLLASSKLITDFLECVKGVLSVLDWGARDEQPKEPSPPGAVPASVPYVPLRRVVDTMEQQLRVAGLSEKQVQRITFGTLKVLLEEPKGGAGFVREVASER